MKSPITEIACETESLAELRVPCKSALTKSSAVNWLEKTLAHAVNNEKW